MQSSTLVERDIKSDILPKIFEMFKYLTKNDFIFTGQILDFYFWPLPIINHARCPWRPPFTPCIMIKKAEEGIKFVNLIKLN